MKLVDTNKTDQAHITIRTYTHNGMEAVVYTINDTKASQCIFNGVEYSGTLQEVVKAIKTT